MSAFRHFFLKFVFFALAGAFFVGAIHVLLFVTRPASEEKEYKEIMVPEGASFRSVARQLQREGLVTDRLTFIAIGKLMGVTRSIRAGFYSLNTGMKPTDIIEILEKGKIIEYEVVVPEGYDIYKIADVLVDKGLVKRDEFLARAFDPEYVKRLGLSGETLEGRLFPATYFFPKGITLDGIIKQMVAKYREVFDDRLKARADELGVTELQAVTIASLVEKETGQDSERPLISAVFHNRLRKGMPMQCDPCVIYALQRRGRWYGDLNRENLRFKDPYNTYVYSGLPPGPIASPGKASITAALYPADVDYIYFVSKNDGTHFFSSNLAQHNRAVHEYQTLAKLQAMRNETTASADKPAGVPRPPGKKEATGKGR